MSGQPTAYKLQPSVLAPAPCFRIKVAGTRNVDTFRGRGMVRALPFLLKLQKTSFNAEDITSLTEGVGEKPIDDPSACKARGVHEEGGRWMAFWEETVWRWSPQGGRIVARLGGHWTIYICSKLAQVQSEFSNAQSLPILSEQFSRHSI